jgi:hypothetical protein
MWGIYVFLQPFYVFTSGLPQPGDLFVVILLPFIFFNWDGRLSKRHLFALRPLMWFTVWVVVIAVGWAIAYGNYGVFGTNTFLMYPIYYVYNTLIFVGSLVLYRRFGDRFLRVTLYTLYATVLLQVVASFVVPSTTQRGSVFFNNPNQLGYFALLVACLIVLLHWKLGQRLLITGGALTCCAYLAVASASRSALAGIAILFLVLLVANPRVIIAASLAAIGLVTVGGPIADAIHLTEKRAFKPSTQASFFEERGYDRIWKHKEYLLIGAGEGGLWRFDETALVKQMEMHSSAGTILFSYGIVGVLLFSAFVWRLARRASWRLLAVLLPPLIYAVAHQSLRFTLFWVLLAVFVAMKDTDKKMFDLKVAKI